MDLTEGRAALHAIAGGATPPRWSREAARAAIDAHPVTMRRARLPDPALGTWDTPWREADALAAAVVCGRGDGDRVDVASWGDPCCGVGRLVVALYDAWVRSTPCASWPARLRTLMAGDVDVDAVCVARDALACAVVASLANASNATAVARAALEVLDTGIVVADALDTLRTMRRPAVVATNPPFVSMRRMHRTLGAEAVRALRTAHPECHGAFDLGVPIVARALDATHDGAFGLVAPTAWQTVDYARGLRARLEARAWHRVATDRRPFGAAVDVVVVATGGGGGPRFHWTPDTSAPGCVPLASLAEVWAGTPGFEAQAVANALVERDAAAAAGWAFVTSARVGAWALRDRSVRFMGATWQRPWLPRAAVQSEARRARYDRAAWLVPGVAAALRAAWSPAPAALGVGVLAVAPRPDVHALVGATLNAASTTETYRAHHPGAALSNGYVRLSVGMLSAVPVPDPQRPDVQAALPRIGALVQAAVEGDASAGDEATACVDRLRDGVSGSS